MEYIPYYDFSTFPVSSNKVLEIINSVVINGFKFIIVDFGEYFPWTIDHFRKSKLAYSEQLIEKIVTICYENEVILIPVLSILTKNDFILEGDKYKYLRNDGIKSSCLNILSCGVNKLVEDLHDDIFSLLVNSDYLLIELPYSVKRESYKIISSDFVSFIKRAADNLSESGKHLILDWHQSDKSRCNLENINFISKKLDKKINITNSIFYSLDMYISKIILKNKDYLIAILHGTDEFTGGSDIGLHILSYKNNKKYNEDNIINSLKQFYFQLDAIWHQIRICWEDLSYIYRDTDSFYRIRYCRSVSLLNTKYEQFKFSVSIILDNLEDYYQPGVLKNWTNSKLDSVLGQLSKLEDIASPMSDGY